MKKLERRFETEEEAIAYANEHKQTGFMLMDLEKVLPDLLEEKPEIPRFLMLWGGEFEIGIAKESMN